MFKKNHKGYFRRLLFVFLFLVMPLNFANASDEDDGDFVMHHVADSHTWHICTINDLHVTFHLPVVIYSENRGLDIFSSSQFFDKDHKKVYYNSYSLNSHDKVVSLDAGNIFYDFSITKNVSCLFISIIMLFFVFIKMAKQYNYNEKDIKISNYYVPRGLNGFLEQMICFVKNEIAVPCIGKTKYIRFMPYLLTAFFFIWINNLMGLLPGWGNLTGNVSCALVLASFTFILTNINGNKHYWGHIFNMPGIPKPLLVIMIPIEIVGIFIKPMTLTIRLFANITAGHIILLSIINLIFIFKSPLTGLISVPFGTFMLCLKLLVAFLQAYVFTLLSAIYIGKAMEEHH
jgi:F-type H+-transporting ATPase subunit a